MLRACRARLFTKSVRLQYTCLKQTYTSACCSQIIQYMSHNRVNVPLSSPKSYFSTSKNTSSSSRIPRFFAQSPRERRDTLAQHGFDVTGIKQKDIADGGLNSLSADKMIENVVGTYSLPIGVAVNMTLNEKDIVVPMVLEEPSVVAAVSNMSRLVRDSGGITATSTEPIMIGQVQLINVPDLEAAERNILAASDRFIAHAKELQPELTSLGGGLVNVNVRRIRYDECGEEEEDMLVVHFEVNCLDAMGANMVNTICEAFAPVVADLSRGTPVCRILSNLADQRTATAKCTVPFHALTNESSNPGLSGADIAERMASAYRFAYADPYRAATHNKGIFNGIDAVCVATGNDWRAIEAGAHAFASRTGVYRPLSSWKVDRDRQEMYGEITLPVAVGIVGGTTKVHPLCKANLDLMGVTSARGLGEILAAVGLVQNMGAVRALAAEGIQQGHMAMHNRAIAGTHS